MSEYDDGEGGFDESEGTDATVRELRAEVIRLESQLDQLAASVRDREREAAAIRARAAELEEGLRLLKAGLRRDQRLLLATWVMVLASLALSLYTYFTA